MLKFIKTLCKLDAMGFQYYNEGNHYNSQLDINPNLNVVFTDETTKFNF